MLIDKGYYDYDFEAVKKAKVEDVAPRNREETQKLVARFGIGVKPSVAQGEGMSVDELQRMAMESENAKFEIK